MASTIGPRGWARALVMLLIVVGTPLVFVPDARADAGDVVASACLTGEAGPRDLVVETGIGAFFRTISLYCGDPTKGIVHITQEHAIAEDGTDDDNVVDCMDAIIGSGDEVDSAQGNEAYQAKRSDGGTATLVWDGSTDEVVTMFTSDPGGNNWAACAELI